MSRVLHDVLEQSGVEVWPVSGSGKSSSQYLEVRVNSEKRKVRISDHALPVEHSDANGAADYEVTVSYTHLATPASVAPADTHNAEVYRPLVERLIRNKRNARELGFDIDGAIAKAKEAMHGKKQMPGSFRSLAAKAEKRGDKETAEVLRQIADLNDARKNPPKKAAPSSQATTDSSTVQQQVYKISADGPTGDPGSSLHSLTQSEQGLSLINI